MNDPLAQQIMFAAFTEELEKIAIQEGGLEKHKRTRALGDGSHSRGMMFRRRMQELPKSSTGAFMRGGQKAMPAAGALRKAKSPLLADMGKSLATFMASRGKKA